ncbi:hypothetical protein DER44DRAFT_904357 [Fusarium oxysporum]|nr:hypothetical protein DER44DRAFT_904357 [Fusarium oxysporum]
MPGRLEGKIALVSGSTQGFGRGILEAFIREGAALARLDQDLARSRCNTNGAGTGRVEIGKDFSKKVASNNNTEHLRPLHEMRG